MGQGLKLAETIQRKTKEKLNIERRLLKQIRYVVTRRSELIRCTQFDM